MLEKKKFCNEIYPLSQSFLYANTLRLNSQLIRICLYENPCRSLVCQLCIILLDYKLILPTYIVNIKLRPKVCARRKVNFMSLAQNSLCFFNHTEKKLLLFKFYISVFFYRFTQCVKHYFLLVPLALTLFH